VFLKGLRPGILLLLFKIPGAPVFSYPFYRVLGDDL